MSTWNRRMAAATRVREVSGIPEAVDDRLRSLGLPMDLHPDDVVAIMTLLRLAESRGSGFGTTVFARVGTDDGDVRTVKVTVFGSEQGVATLVSDSHEDLVLDSLTGLPGRGYLLSVLEASLQSTLSKDHSVAVFSIDIDRFKTVNDSRGFAEGDAALRTLAAGLEDTLDDGESIARLGGDEFTIIAPKVFGVSNAMTLAERFRSVCSNATIDSPLSGLTVSVGVAIGRTDRSSEDMLREAETALYQAKGLGRDRCEIFDEELRSKVERRITVDQQLRRALDNDGIHVHYQPIVEVATREVVGMEALLRIVGDDGRHLNPRELVEAAEDGGLIRRIEETVLERGAKAMQMMPDGGEDLFLSVNVSDRQLADSRYPLALARTLNTADFPAEQLHLEINRTLLDSKGAAIRLVTQLDALGVSVVIDEFIGASDAELVVPEGVNMIKLDKRLVHGVHTDRGRARAELAVGGILDRGLDVCAVGVETEDDFRAIKELGCTHAQGYLFSPPVDSPQLKELIASAL